MSSFKNKNPKSSTALSKGDIDFYKKTGVFALVCIFVLLAMKMKSTLVERIASGNNLTYNFYNFSKSPVFFVLAGLVVVASVVWFAFCRVKKVDESHRIFTSTNCLSLVLYLAFFTACFSTEYPSNQHSFFIATTIILAMIYYISKIYNSDFILYTIITAAVSVCIYALDGRFGIIATAIRIVVIVASVLSIIYFKKIVKKLRVSKKRKSSYIIFPLYISLIIGFVFFAWKYVFHLFPQANLFYLTSNVMLTVMAVQFIVFAIIYTIRLIKE